ncbi:Nuclear control of ATPase protein 2 [Coemansia sp. RSA 2337]|nr:Nuclear control of ATPase protein 2 [Coemansia sp. S3946]KAJ2045230.1 Nuclear control of ATPase protein 2 [Coemansia sp. S16]KAJ2071169.1 Nuclear control of ATPase protein 2 [Coemansia sp. S155-1]KAJ2110643.1 Nuclear control of ATPase protein 2 [Coemansia sp. RSA 922]KAJ2451967.1 Nuclear control of ATPase protein 2 [Coemansia sp. RSA 2337]
MSFVSEHYGNVFRALALNTMSPGSQYQEEQTVATTGAATDSDQAAPESEPTTRDSTNKKLAQRAFDLSTLVLAGSSATNRLQQSPQYSPSAESGKADDAVNQEAFGGVRPSASGVRVAVTIPSLSSIISDLHLVRSSLADNVGATALGQERAAELILMSAIAGIHAYTVEQLLDSALPLSIDMDYWNAQDDGALSLAIYFIQSLPQRLVSWGVRTADALLNYAASAGTAKESALDHIRAVMTSRLLFPELCTDKVSKRHIRMPRIPESANILSLTRREIRHKQQQLADGQERLAEMLGSLSQVAVVGRSSRATPEALLQQVSDIISALGHSDMATRNTVQPPLSIGQMAQSAEQIAILVQGISTRFNEGIRMYCRPSLLARCWMPALVCVVGARSLALYVAGHRKDIEGWTIDAVAVASNYVSQYILAPLRSAYETIRYGTHTYSVMTEDSLRSDLRSLEDMVVGFTERFGSSDPALVRQRVESGDLSDVMRVYAREVQQPFRNAVFGDLVQAMLIQVQKVKVDVGQTMAALDKLLKSNELNFLLLSTVPATLSVYVAARWLFTRVTWWLGGSSRYTATSIQSTMRDIDRLLNIDEGECPADDNDCNRLLASTQGRLICLTHYLRHHAAALPNSASAGWLGTSGGWLRTLPLTRSLFFQDIRDLESAQLTGFQKRHVIERMYRTFRFL